jgi:hypothetical protein
MDHSIPTVCSCSTPAKDFEQVVLCLHELLQSSLMREKALHVCQTLEETELTTRQQKTSA